SGSRSKGAAIAEAGAAMCLILPVVFVVLFAVLEASYAYLIKDNLTQAARAAARNLAIAYVQNPDIVGNRALQESMVLDRVRLANFVNDSRQFDDPTFDTASDPPFVSVTVRYLGGQFGLPPFPNPDPLHLGGRYTIVASSTYRTE
ncbi:MAG: pilus assembly protein, partial [Candidatus Melainabacteria bacterium]|nr:pilus assembly protein [Candidatus Melainabacteria bacterium]